MCRSHHPRGVELPINHLAACGARSGRRYDRAAMPDASTTPAGERSEKDELAELYENALERLQLIGGDDDAIAAFLDELEIHGRASARCSASSLAPPRSPERTGSTRITGACSWPSRASAATATTARRPALASPL